MKNMMKKYESIKQIDLTDREHYGNRSATKISSRLNSHSKSSKRSFSRDQDHMDCFTDRSRGRRINQFNCNFPQSPAINKGGYIGNKSDIKTYIRFKPFSKTEILEQNETNEDIIEIESCNSVRIKQNLSFGFDYVFDPDTHQKKVYQQTTKQLVHKFIQGYNATVFAYGQTGSGKTYTMFGEQDTSKRGVILQAINDIFWELEIAKDQHLSHTLSCSMLEIYKENLIDLLADQAKDIKVKENISNGIQIQNLYCEEVSSQKDIMRLIHKGSELRKIRGTDVNQRSSRSHLIFTIYLHVKISEFEYRTSKLNLVDLAGSQKVSKTKVSGEGLEEAKKINLSLSCLGNTINALSKGQQHIPYRDSKLTRVLQESLSGNSITRVIITCSLHSDCRQQTISSLKFGNRVKKIKTMGVTQNNHKISEAGVNKYMYQSLKISYQSCQQKLEKIKILVQNSQNRGTKQQLMETLNTILMSQIQSLTPRQTKYTDQNMHIPNMEKQQKTNFDKKLFQGQTTNNTIRQLEQKIKDLETIVIKQQKVIEDQEKQLKNVSSRKQNRGHESHSIAIKNKWKSQHPHKLKILKINQNNRSKQTNTKKEVSEEKKIGIVITPRTFTPKNVGQNTAEHDKNNSTLISQFLQEFKRFKKSYEKMEKEILNHQVNDLMDKIRQIKKDKGVKQSESPKKYKFYKDQVQEKDKYIMELEKKLIVAFEFIAKGQNKFDSPLTSEPSSLHKIGSMKNM